MSGWWASLTHVRRVGFFGCGVTLLALGCSTPNGHGRAKADDLGTTTGTAEDVPTLADEGPAAETVTTPDEGPETVSPGLPPRICKAGTTWTPGQAAFKDVTAAAGFEKLGVAGFRLSAADFDGDGFVDISVRDHVPGGRDDFSEGGKRLTWLLRNTGAFTFEDVTQASGFTQVRDENLQGRTTHVVVWGDVDNDGDLDAFAGVNSADPTKFNGDLSELMLNQGDGTFVLGEGGALRHVGQSSSTSAASFLDVDKDGKLDLWVGYDTNGDQFAPDKLYLGDGTGSTVDGTALMGVTSKAATSLAVLNSGQADHRSWGTTVCDLNADGWPDLLTSAYGRGMNGLWLSDGGGGYLSWGVESGYARDHRDDWTTNLNAQCYCKLTPNAAGCDTAPDPPGFFPCSSTAGLRWNHQWDREPFRLGGNTFTTVCGDIDNDGDLDLMNFEIVHWDVGESSDPSEILLSDGAAQPVFARFAGSESGIDRDWDGHIDWNAGDMTGAFLDFDNDGRLDIYVGSSDYPYTRGFLYHQKTDGSFEEVSPDVGIAHPRSHGVAVSDLDNDGDLDLVAGHSRSRCGDTGECYDTKEVHVFENVMGQDGNWLELRLTGGQGTNKSAIGAQVRVTAGGVTQTRTVDGGHGHYGIQHGLALHFGLGAACDIDSIEVRWPNAKDEVQLFTGVRANYRVDITQGQEPTYLTE